MNYQLTDRGKSLRPVLMAMINGDFSIFPIQKCLRVKGQNNWRLKILSGERVYN